MGSIYDQKGESKNPRGMWNIQIHTHIKVWLEIIFHKLLRCVL